MMTIIATIHKLVDDIQAITSFGCSEVQTPRPAQPITTRAALDRIAQEVNQANQLDDIELYKLAMELANNFAHRTTSFADVARTRPSRLSCRGWTHDRTRHRSSYPARG